jgi:hypothetical protein
MMLQDSHHWRLMAHASHVPSTSPDVARPDRITRQRGTAGVELPHEHRCVRPVASDGRCHPLQAAQAPRNPRLVSSAQRT